MATMRNLLAAASILALSACSQLANLDPSGHKFGRVDLVEVPDTTDVTNIYNKIGAVFAQQPSPITPSSYVAAGYQFVDDKCDEFFVELTNAQRRIDFTRKEVILGLSTTTAILALARNAAQTLAYVAAGGALITSSIDNYEDYVV